RVVRSTRRATGAAGNRHREGRYRERDGAAAGAVARQPPLVRRGHHQSDGRPPDGVLCGEVKAEGHPHQPMTRALMIQGTASHVGKSVLTAAFGRWLRDRGLRVAPFKAQNMSLNSAVTARGEEIARSQAAQAEALGVEPTAD